MTYKRGYFITFEGVEGCGKSTQVRRLAAWLRRRGQRVRVTREPGGTAAGERVRRILLHRGRLEMSTMTETLLFMAARAELAASIIHPAVRRGELVLCDRFLDATVAYQGHAGGVPVPTIWHLGRLVTGGLQPDLTILLDMDPREGLRRVTGQRDRIERRRLAFHRRVRRGYLAIARAHHRRVVVVDGTPDPGAVAQTVQAIVQRRLERRRGGSHGR